MKSCAERCALQLYRTSLNFTFNNILLITNSKEHFAYVLNGRSLSDLDTFAISQIQRSPQN